eukprot:TRINITY_DN8710_c0_g1_i2.p1 TRINITY_DN8710_c0_g1~~TRINITY_DN8710_c0_g1_i2.p1  ORF type:complete len:359 (+),score=131.43 TRINITY_DN8710_c0_g1_i2:96-1079(+)
MGINTIGGPYMTPEELNETKEKIVRLLKESDERKLENNEYLTENEVEDEDKDILQEDSSQEEILHVAIAELCGALFATHREMTLPFVHQLYENVLARVLAPDQSDRLKQFGLFLIDDMIEHLGIELIPDLWPHLSEALIRYATHPTVYVRLSAVYGIGVLALRSKEAFAEISQQCLKALYEALDTPKGEEELKAYIHCRANVIAAFGKIIRSHPEKIDINKVLDTWLSNLPLSKDKKEALEQHELLCEIIIADSTLVFGSQLENLPRIANIFGTLLETKYSNAEIEKKARMIFQQMLTQENYKNALISAVGSLTAAQQGKFKRLLEA